MVGWRHVSVAPDGHVGGAGIKVAGPVLVFLHLLPPLLLLLPVIDLIGVVHVLVEGIIASLRMRDKAHGGSGRYDC